MAYGIELILGYPYKEWGQLGITKKESGRLVSDERYDDESEPLIFQNTRPLLKAAWKLSMEEMEFVFKKGKDGGYEIWTTPLGDREFTGGFYLEACYDPDEMGDRPEDATIGVHISGRYFPTFADWEDTCGTISPMIFSGGLEKAMAIAKKNIEKAVPQMTGAHWIVKQIHY